MPRFTIEAMPAKQGDALLVEWGTSRVTHRMLIDAGTAAAYRSGIRDRLMALPVKKGVRPIDLLVITHIDNDHIEGVIELLLDDDLALRPADIWFNGWKHIRGPRMLGAKEGEWLGALMMLQDRPWNRAFNGRVVRTGRGRLPRRDVGGMEIVLLSPGEKQIEALRDKWADVITDAGGTPGDFEAAIGALRKKGKLGAGPMLGRAGRDRSEANGSSIAFLCRYAGRTALLSGDAFHSVLADGLTRFGREEKSVGPVPVDLYKVSHHGSFNNVNAALLDALDCPRYLISTNGDQHEHPDRLAVDLIIDSRVGSDGPPTELVFNYRTKFTRAFSAKRDQRDRSYVAQYPETPGFVTVDLSSERL